MAQRHVPGTSVAVSIGGQLAYARGYDLADIEHRVAVTPATRFQSASTLKTLTATAVLQLAQSHRLENQPLRDRAPGGRGWPWLLATVDDAAAPRLIGSNWTGSSGLMFIPA